MAKQPEIVTASMLAIGDELLSGRTKDRNIAYLADFLTVAGIDLREVRIVPDEQSAIVAAVNALRDRFDYVFTSGGIGPTHDDITADAIAAAFGVPIDHDPRALAIMEPHYAARGIEFTEARRRMARLPHGSALIDNPVSVAPGFTIGNVHVLAGVPSIFQAMLESLAPGLRTGARMESRSVDCGHPEGSIGSPLAQIQKEHAEVAIGSYPKYDGQTFSTQIVIRGRRIEAIEAACAEIRELVEALDASEAKKPSA